MRKIKKLYNILSVMLRKVENCVRERDFEKMRNLEDRYQTLIVENLKVKFPDLFDRDTNNVSEISEWHLEQSPLTDDLELYAAKTQDMEELIFLIKYLDCFLEDTFYSCIPVDMEEYHFESLNDNVSACGIILLPRVPCRWEHKNRNAYTAYSMEYYLRNFYYVSKENLEDYTVQHIIMPRKIFYRALQIGELRIAVSPVLAERVVEVSKPYSRENVMYVSVKPMEQMIEKKILENSLNVLEKAAEEEADILVFPEMMGTEKIQQELRLELYRRERIADNEFPKLIISPSIWEKQKNSCRILNDMGETIAEQCKHHGMDVKTYSAKEDIISDRTIYIFHCHGIGRIAVAICKDFLLTSYLRILFERLKVSLLLVPSFSPRIFHFEMLAHKYGELDCGIIWVNSCSAVSSDTDGEIKDSVTLAYFSGRAGISKIGKTVKELCQNQRACAKGCIYIYRICLNKEAV